jgi:hypothetical protein
MNTAATHPGAQTVATTSQSPDDAWMKARPAVMKRLTAALDRIDAYNCAKSNRAILQLLIRPSLHAT